MVVMGVGYFGFFYFVLFFDGMNFMVIWDDLYFDGLIYWIYVVWVVLNGLLFD